jgi:spermidine synthase
MLLVILAGAYGSKEAGGAVVFEVTSAYHHIRVLDEQGFRLLSFNGSQETRMSLRNPLQGHFEYTEFFHMPWLWNTQMNNVLMIGLGGASIQRAYQHYYPDVAVETAEIDPLVVQVAKQYFLFRESPMQQVHIEDGRVFLRRSQTQYGAIILDAYVQSRYGASIPYHLTTKEFFELASRHLTTNGVLAFNVIGTLRGWRADIVGAVYRTMKSVFPQVYLFPASESYNVVLIGTKTEQLRDFNWIEQSARSLIRSRRITLPTFGQRILSFHAELPIDSRRCPIFTDDYAPVDGLLSGGR